MAEKLAVAETYLTCYVCSEIFSDPVTLSCYHSFCSGCLEKWWEQATAKNCPICRRRLSKDLPVNFALKEVADIFAERQAASALKVGKAEPHRVLVCSKHQAECKGFSEGEQRAVCRVCEASLHLSDKVVPIEEAISQIKDQMKMDSRALREKRNTCEKVEDTYKEMIKHCQDQQQQAEETIRAKFKELHQFLNEEEGSRLADLQEEGEQKRKMLSREMGMIRDRMSSLNDNLSVVREELQKPAATLLSSFKATRGRVEAQCSLPDPQLVSGGLIDVPKHLGNLPYRVWEKMKDRVHFSPIILDPNTAHPRLYLSDDLTGVRYGDTKQQLPDNPERHTHYANVVGSEGFSSGTHRWDVEVGDHSSWLVGLATETSERKKEIYPTSDSGVWCLLHRGGKYTSGLDEPIKVKKHINTIHIRLDYDEGRVSFYDDDMAEVYRYNDTFTEKLFPLFCVRSTGDGKTTGIKIC